MNFWLWFWLIILIVIVGVCLWFFPAITLKVLGSILKVITKVIGIATLGMFKLCKSGVSKISDRFKKKKAKNFDNYAHPSEDRVRRDEFVDSNVFGTKNNKGVNININMND